MTALRLDTHLRVRSTAADVEATVGLPHSVKNRGECPPALQSPYSMADNSLAE